MTNWQHKEKRNNPERPVQHDLNISLKQKPGGTSRTVTEASAKESNKPKLSFADNLFETIPETENVPEKTINLKLMSFSQELNRTGVETSITTKGLSKDT